MSNIILNTDSYKHSHFRQYPKGCETVSSYIESRGGDHAYHLFFGLQAWLKTVLATPVSLGDVDEAAWFCNQHGVPFHRAGWESIVRDHGGYLPLLIEAIPEGSILPTRQVLVQVRNTDPDAFWLTSFVETSLLRAIWYPTTVATNSAYARARIDRALAETSTANAHQVAPFMLHDFGARGVSSEESAALGGLAHLVSFEGTDTMSALIAAKRFYDEPMAGFSVPAAEHATMTSWTKTGETDAYANMLNEFADAEIVSIVSDSYDIFHAVEKIFGGTLKAAVEKRGARGKRLVIRPDSGDPVTTPIKIVQLLMDRFGFDINKKGFRVLPDFLRVLQGDGITPTTLGFILDGMAEAGLSAENIVFGMGSGLLQQVNRDTLKFAMKCSAIKVDGQWRDVFKDPVGDPGKSSKRGVLALTTDAQAPVLSFQTVRASDLKDRPNLLRPVYQDGKIMVHETLLTIRNRAARDRALLLD